MSETEKAPIVFVTSVLHPTDFSEIAETAFAHALAISIHNHARLTLLHSEQGGHERWTSFPSVRKTLERWHLLPKGSPRSAVADELAIDVRKVQAKGKSPLDAIRDYAAEHEVELIVLATEGRVGISRLMQPSIAEQMARQTKTMTLVVPQKARGFVSHGDGRVSLGRVLVPVDEKPDPSTAIAAATLAARSMSKGSVELYVLHVGDALPPVTLPQEPGCSWRKMATPGDPVETILEMAKAHDADLIVMATEGHRGIVDTLKGSVTERVLRQAPCPVLAVPAR